MTVYAGLPRGSAGNISKQCKIASRRRFLRLFGLGTALQVSTPQLLAQVNRPSEERQDRPNQNFIRLDRNENPYGPSQRVIHSMTSALASANRYPFDRDRPAQQIAEFHRVKPEQVLVGCGSTEILRMAAFAFLGRGRRLVHASPTFEAIEHYGRSAGAEIISVPLAGDFSHDLERMLGQLGPSTGLVYVCNPNNPTATITPRQDLESFIAKMPKHVRLIIDEAYSDYAGRSGMYASFLERPLVDDRIIVSRTFSTAYGLAGLRFGYAVASPALVRQMQPFSTEQNVNSVVAPVIGVALQDRDSLQEFVRRNADDRQEFFNQAMARALKPIDSHANFVMMDTMHPAEDVIGRFRESNILIGRPFAAMNTHIRVSLGGPQDMTAFWKTWDMLPYAKGVMQH
jgi:histidinol-phosphate aminotransferase